MVPSILLSRHSLLREITKLQTEIKDLKERFNLVISWVNIQYDGKDLPDEIRKATKWSTETTKSSDEAVVLSEEKADSHIVHRKKKRMVPPSGDCICSICNKKLKNLLVLKAHVKEHLPEEVLVPLSRKKGDKPFKRRRHAYRCLTCGIILTDRRKYLGHVSKHRKDSTRNEKTDAFAKVRDESVEKSRQNKLDQCGNIPFVKLIDINSLKQIEVLNLKKENGISHFNSVVLSTQTQLHRDVNEKSDSIFEEEVPCSFATDDEETCDPLGDVNSPFWEQDEQEDTEDGTQDYTDTYTRMSQSDEDDDILTNSFKEEITEESEIFKVEVTEECDCEDQGDSVAVTDNFIATEIEPLPKESVKNRRKSTHKLLFENEDSNFNVKISDNFSMDGAGSETQLEPSQNENVKNRRKSLRKVVSENETRSNNSVCDVDSNNSSKDDSDGVICDVCNKRLKNKLVLKSHKQIHKIEHLPPEALLPWRDDGRDWGDYKGQRHKYRCLVCQIVLTDKRKYISHVKSHERESMSKGTSTAKAKEHESSNLEDSAEYSCDICNAKFRKKSSLNSHKSEHLPPEVLLPWRDDGTDRGDYKRQRHKYRCLVCQIVMTDKRKYISHVKSHERESMSKGTSTSTSPTKERESSNLEDTAEYSCDICNAKYSKKASLKSHRKEHLPNEVVLPYHSDREWPNEKKSRNRYRCTFCEIIMTDKRRYIKHVNAHKMGLTDLVSDDGPWKCRFCSKIIKTRSTYIRHEAAHENPNSVLDNTKRSNYYNKRFFCDVCGKAFHCKSNLEIHMNNHTGKKPFLCFLCGRGFIRKSYLLNHELTHSEKRNFKCQYCEKSFKQVQSKYIHEQRHKESTQVICNLCGFTFRGVRTLKQHIEGVHENLRPYHCNLCDSKFKQKAALKYHLKAHANPNSRHRSINRDVDPLKAAAKRRHKAPPNVIPIIPSL